MEAHAGDFGEDGDAALFFQIVGIHDAFGDCFMGGKDAALAEHGVDQRSLAVVNVRNDSDVTSVLTHLIFFVFGYSS